MTFLLKMPTEARWQTTTKRRKSSNQIYNISHIYALFCLLCCCLIPNGIRAQVSGTAFGLVESSGAELSVEVARDTAKWNRANRIYQELVAAKGDYRFAAPPFKLSANKKNIAFMEGDALSIGLELEAYEILDKYGDAAFAFILGHEVSHFYEKHAYHFKVFREYRDLELNKALAAAQKKMRSKNAYQALAMAVQTSRKRIIKVNTEMEADYLGGFLAYSAGYDIRQVPELFDALYDGYEIDTSLVFGYVSKQERKQMAQDAMKKMEEFVDVFEVANLLVIMDRYTDARVLYKYILQEYQGREIYNNLGVLTVLEALTLFDPEEQKYRLPLELDLNINGTKGGDDKQILLRERLLDEALSYFNSATSLDRAYAPAYLNKACVYFIQKDYDRAVFYANIEAKQKAAAAPDRFPNTALNADILSALVDLETPGAEEKGISALETMRESSLLAEVNLQIANGKKPQLPKAKRSPRPMNWKVDGIENGQMDSLVQNTMKAKVSNFFGELTLRKWLNENSTTFLIEPPLGSDRPKLIILATNPDTEQKAFRGIGVGTESSEILALYKQPQEILNMVNGEVWKYDGRYLFIGKDGTLKRWMVTKNM